jgi:hypothetical protein
MYIIIELESFIYITIEYPILKDAIGVDLPK